MSAEFANFQSVVQRQDGSATSSRFMARKNGLFTILVQAAVSVPSLPGAARSGVVNVRMYLPLI
jgi:hypothetical protein